MQHKVVLQVMREGTARAEQGDLKVLRVMASELALWFPQHAQSMDARWLCTCAAWGFDPPRAWCTPHSAARGIDPRMRWRHLLQTPARLVPTSPLPSVMPHLPWQPGLHLIDRLSAAAGTPNAAPAHQCKRSA